MKKTLTILGLMLLLLAAPRVTRSQCSICAKTAAQMGEKPAKGLNNAIIYLMLTPFAIMGFVGYRWWRQNRES